MDTLFHTEPKLPPAAHFIRVAVERRVELRSPTNDGLTYAWTEPLQIGQRVEIPLGRGNAPATGVVVASGGQELLDGFKVKRIKAVLGSPLTPELVELGQWIARYYVAPLGMTLAGMIPAAVKTDTGRRQETRLELAADPKKTLPKETKLTPTAAAAWKAIANLSTVGWPMTARTLADQIESKTVGPINRLTHAGLLKEIQHSSIRARQTESDSIFDADKQLIPTSEQAQAIEGIAASLGEFSTHLLHGITGSGKTEVYLKLIEQALAHNTTAIMLVPEIALTPQTAGRVQSRFGSERVAVLHSGLTAAQRNSAWASILDGSAKVVVGARSAIFAPLKNIGIIIVDEEHDSSYKQDQLPRYNARDVAIKRAHAASCPVLLGSATPSLESWANAVANKSTLWNLPNRVGGGTLPRVRVVDMFEERQLFADKFHRAPPSELLVGPTLQTALERTLSAGGQVVLLLNKRGLAGFVGCCSSSCKWALECDHCSAKMVVHRLGSVPQGGYVRCHHCAAEQIFPKQCPDCAQKIRQFGAGTQRAEEVIEELSQAMPESCRLISGDTLVRVDADTMRTGRDLFATLARFARGDIRVLLGTQMIAKGLDVPNVRLVGVLSADTALNLPDFRAGERTFQLVSQVAGRAGRGKFPGEVIVQTFEPDAPAIALAADHAYHQFASEELHLRSAVGLPPARRMARIVCRDKNLAKAKQAAQAIADAAAELVDQNAIRMMGPMPCPIERIADHFRIAIELSAANSATLQQAMHTLRARGVLLGDSKTAIDVDPLALL